MTTPTAGEDAPRFRSLATDALGRIVLWAGLLVLLVTAVGYVATYRAERERTLAELRRYATERQRQEQSVFARAEDNLATFSELFVELYRNAPTDYAARFDRAFRIDPAGALRLDPAWYHGTYTEDGEFVRYASAFIGARRGELDQDFKRRAMLALELVARLGPAWTQTVANLHASFPENALVMYWPEEPWGLRARSDLVMTDGAVIRATLQSENPERHPVWTGLYYDFSVGQWMITYQVPVDLDGRHLVTPSHDVLLTELLDRLATSAPAGASNLLLGRDGTLVAHPGYLDELRHRGVLDIGELGDASLSEIHARVAADPPPPGGVRVIADDALDAYLAVADIDGPGWWLVTVYPQELIARGARGAANMIGLLGALLMGIVTVVVFAVLRRKVAAPIADLQHAAQRVGEGRYAEVAQGGLPTGERSEIGTLARAFRAMALRVAAHNQLLEFEVAERTRELAEANRRLEALTLTDPLTGLGNRRAFDLALAHLRERDAPHAQARPFALALIDVDHFKSYNDGYGHSEGDTALRRVAEALRDAVDAARVQVFRYGGEEFAALLDVPTLDEALPVVEAQLDAVTRLHLRHKGSPLGILTASAGLALWTPATATDERDDEALIRRADRQLYLAKRRGRARACAGEE